ncbi:hypothetical protein Tsubulata_036526 [Turnera subulata]|uniref:RRM domain-containing protein n=1 Tax=Turnera subulata TaxID=218843 RepID=A0A9Q0FS90_9ROSI|nr:hypothetical protein Tsubulata_036526 [Turnera subulata]
MVGQPPYLSRWSRTQVQQAINNGEVVTLYVENLAMVWKPMDIHRILSKYGEVVDVYVPNKRNKERKRFGFVRYRGIKDTQRLLMDVNKVQTEEGVLKENVARTRSVIRPTQKPYVPPPSDRGVRAEHGRSYADTVKDSSPKGGKYCT